MTTASRMKPAAADLWQRARDLLWPRRELWSKSEALRAQVLELLEKSKRTRRAADDLWSDGHLDHALELGERAFLELMLAVDLSSAPQTEPLDSRAGLERWLEAQGVRDGRRRMLLVAARLLDNGEPAADALGTRAATRRYEVLTEAFVSLARLLERQLWTAPRLAWARRIRLLAALLLSIVVALCIMMVRARPAVRASGQYSSEFAPENATDGLLATEWLPPSTPAFIELRFERPRLLQSVRLCNGHNRFYLDRAVNRYRVEAYLGAKLLETHDGRFFGIRSDPVCDDIIFAQVTADRVLVHVLSHFGVGAALAELEVH